MKKVYIVHGYGASPDSHWFPWLANQVKINKNIEVMCVPLPNPETPKLSEWLAALDQHTPSLDEDSYFVAHSLGAITLLRFLHDRQETIGGLLLVSGFTNSLSRLPQLDAFTVDQLNFSTLRNLSKQSIVIAAKDDTIVPYTETALLAEKLAATLITLEHGGHFLKEDGFVEFPVAYEQLRQILE
ncbi:putative hydrolase YdeN [compost metagenome]